MEVEELTLAQFNLMFTGHLRREENEWDKTRNIMSFILNYGGNGGKKLYQPDQVLPLHKDKKKKTVKKITSDKEAYELLKEFE